jgi:hypothetical protein
VPLQLPVFVRTSKIEKLKLLTKLALFLLLHNLFFLQGGNATLETFIHCSWINGGLLATLLALLSAVDESWVGKWMRVRMIVELWEAMSNLRSRRGRACRRRFR